MSAETNFQSAQRLLRYAYNNACEGKVERTVSNIDKFIDLNLPVEDTGVVAALSELRDVWQPDEDADNGTLELEFTTNVAAVF